MALKKGKEITYTFLDNLIFKKFHVFEKIFHSYYYLVKKAK